MCCTGIAANLKVNGQIMSNPSLGLDIRAPESLVPIYIFSTDHTSDDGCSDERLKSFFCSFDPVKHRFQSSPCIRLCVALVKALKHFCRNSA